MLYSTSNQALVIKLWAQSYWQSIMLYSGPVRVILNWGRFCIPGVWQFPETQIVGAGYRIRRLVLRARDVGRHPTMHRATFTTRNYPFRVSARWGGETFTRQTMESWWHVRKYSVMCDSAIPTRAQRRREYEMWSFTRHWEFCTRLVWGDEAAWHQEAWDVSGIKGGVAQWGRGPNLDYKLHEDRTLSVLLPCPQHLT